MSCRRELNLWTSTSLHYVNDLFSYLQITMVIQCVSYLILSLSKGSEIVKSVFFLLNYDRPFISSVVHLIWYQYISNQITVGNWWYWKTKKCILACFWALMLYSLMTIQVEPHQCPLHQFILFAQGLIPEKVLRIGGIEKLSFFESAI